MALGTKQILGLALGATAAFFFFQKKKAIQASMQPSAGLAASLAATVTPAAVPAPDQTAQQIRAAGGVAAGAASFIPGAGPAIGTAIGAASSIAATIYSLFQGKPLDPVQHLLIQEMPFNYQGQENVMLGQPVFALDAYGYLHELSSDVNAAGYSWREIVAVNWKIFSMMPKAESIAHLAEMKGREMPRPSDPAVLRSVFGNDMRFKLGNSNDVHGPWEGTANVEPAIGSPAMWAAFAGEYVPTKTETGQFFF